MLTSIEIRNFKAIKDGQDENGNIIDKPLILNGLTNVNYLVGENGSGKSSVLEGLALTNMIKDKDFKLNTYVSRSKKRKVKPGSISPFSPHYVVPVFIPNRNIAIAKMTNGCKIYLSYKDLDQTTKIYFQKRSDWFSKTFNKNNFYIRSKSVLFSSSNQYDPITLLHGELENCHHYNSLWWLINIENEDFDYHEYVEEYGEPKRVDISNLDYRAIQYLKKIDGLKSNNSDGVDYLQSLISKLHYYSLYNFNQFLIDEPENSLHPEIQKMLPDLFKSLSTTYPGIQFLISTHSPFIISATGKIAEEEKLEGKEPSQKVYLIENGQCLNPQGNSGKEVKHKVATKMLGAEIKDFTPSKIVFCAKTERVFLELINDTFYNLDIVFKTTKPDTGDSTLLKVGEVQEILKYGINYYEDTEIFFYRDSLSDTNDDKRWKQQLKSNNDLKNKAIFSDKSMFELKFTDDETEANLAHENPIENAKLQANKLIEKGEAGKSEFQNLFPELSPVFDFF